MARVLIIDDDEVFVKLMTRSLQMRGHDVASAIDGVQGVRAFAASHFDAVVCDIVMPEQEGVQTITEIRTKSSDVAIVAISGGLSLMGAQHIDVLDLAGKLGADVTLKKPFELMELSAALNRALAVHTRASAVSTSGG